jgi:hypothetical protein
MQLVVAFPSDQVAKPLSTCLRVENSLDLVLWLGLVLKVNRLGRWRLHAIHFISLPEREPVNGEDRVEHLVAGGQLKSVHWTGAIFF